MRHLRKTRIKPIRFTPAQWRLVEQAARLESKRRGERVNESTLVRELALAAISAMQAPEAGAA